MSQIRPGDRIGSYTISSELSKRGGMAQVFLAYLTEQPDSRVVLKIARCPDNGHSAFKDLLKTETKILRELRHPGIVRIFPMEIHRKIVYEGRAEGLEGQPWYFVMEYIDGMLLEPAKLVKRFPLAWRIELFYQLLTIINYMHGQGYVDVPGYAHGDLKPDNIIFRQPPAPDQVPNLAVVDFGTASDLDHVGPVLGASPPYAAPELLAAMLDNQYPRRKLLPEKLDVWSLGTILFELVTGRRLIQMQKPEVIVTTLLRGELAKIRDYCPEAPESLDKLLDAMLNRQSAAARPPVHQLLNALEEDIPEIRPPRVITAVSPDKSGRGWPFGRG